MSIRILALLPLPPTFYILINGGLLQYLLFTIITKEALYVTETSESHTVHEGYSVQGCQAEYYIPRHQREAHAETNTPNLNNYTERSV